MMSAISGLDNTFTELVSFLSTDPQCFMSEPAFPPQGVKRVEALGRGSSAVVLELRLDGTREPSVVKFSRDTIALDAESSVLQHIHEHLPRGETDGFPESGHFECDDIDWREERNRSDERRAGKECVSRGRYRRA